MPHLCLPAFTRGRHRGSLAATTQAEDMSYSELYFCSLSHPEAFLPDNKVFHSVWTEKIMSQEKPQDTGKKGNYLVLRVLSRYAGGESSRRFPELLWFNAAHMFLLGQVSQGSVCQVLPATVWGRASVGPSEASEFDVRSILSLNVLSNQRLILGCIPASFKHASQGLETKR